MRTLSCAVLRNIYADGRLVGELLIEADHKVIAFVAGRKETSTSEDREAGPRKGLAVSGCDVAGMVP